MRKAGSNQQPACFSWTVSTGAFSRFQITALMLLSAWVLSGLTTAAWSLTCLVFSMCVFFILVGLVLLRSDKIFNYNNNLSWPSWHGATAITEISLRSEERLVWFWQCWFSGAVAADHKPPVFQHLSYPPGAHTVVMTVVLYQSLTAEGQCLCTQPVCVPQANTVIWSVARPLPWCTVVSLQTWAAVLRLSSWTRHK